MSERVQKPEDGEIRLKLLKAALGLFASRGYAAASVREIVKEAGVTAPVLYYYFGSKEGLYLELMNEALTHYKRVLAEATAGDLTSREKLTRLACGLMALYRTNIRMVRLLYGVFYGPPQGAPYFNFDEFREGLLTSVTELVSEGVARKEFNAPNVESTIWAFLGAMNVVLEGELCMAECSRGEEGMVGVLEIIFRGIEPRGQKDG